MLVVLLTRPTHTTYHSHSSNELHVHRHSSMYNVPMSAGNKSSLFSSKSRTLSCFNPPMVAGRRYTVTSHTCTRSVMLCTQQERPTINCLYKHVCRTTVTRLQSSSSALMWCKRYNYYLQSSET